MHKKFTLLVFILLFFICPFNILAQQNGRIQAIQVRVGARGRGEIESTLLPGDERRILVERRRQRDRRTAGNRHHRDEAVGVEVGGIRHRRFERDARTVAPCTRSPKMSAEPELAGLPFTR